MMRESSSGEGGYVRRSLWADTKPPSARSPVRQHISKTQPPASTYHLRSETVLSSPLWGGARPGRRFIYIHDDGASAQSWCWSAEESARRPPMVAQVVVSHLRSNRPHPTLSKR